MKESFFIVNSKEKGVASEISLYKDLIDVKTHSNDRVRVLKLLVLKDVFLERETIVFDLQRQKRFFVCET